MRPRSVSQLPLTDKDAIPFKQLPKETQEWIIAWNNTYKRLGLTDREVFALYKLTMKIHWGFNTADLEVMPQKERECLAGFRKFWIAQANRIMGNRSKPDPRVAGFLGGKRAKIPRGDHKTIRSEVRRLIRNGMSKKDALTRVREDRELDVSLKTIQRICEDREFNS